jgi:hypothetical protein
MKGKDTKGSQEPVGIVISGTPTPPRGTVFSAYVWGPAPKSTDKESHTS